MCFVRGYWAGQVGWVAGLSVFCQSLGKCHPHFFGREFLIQPDGTFLLRCQLGTKRPTKSRQKRVLESISTVSKKNHRHFDSLFFTPPPMAAPAYPYVALAPPGVTAPFPVLRLRGLPFSAGEGDVRSFLVSRIRSFSGGVPLAVGARTGAHALRLGAYTRLNTRTGRQIGPTAGARFAQRAMPYKTVSFVAVFSLLVDAQLGIHPLRLAPLHATRPPSSASTSCSSPAAAAPRAKPLW